MRRFVPALFHRTPRRQVRSTARALVEAMEPRRLLTASTSDIIQNPFPSTNASVQGRVYQDSNLDGIFDVGDVPLAGQTVFVDVNKDSTPDAGDEIALTDANGEYIMLVPGSTSATAGVFNIGCVVAPDLQFFINAGFYSLQFTPGAVVTNVDFPQIGMGSIDVTVFGDANANGVQDAGEVGLDNRTVFLDNNNNQVFDAGDVQGFPLGGGSGIYEFFGLVAKTYTIRVQQVEGTTITTPAGGSASIVLATGELGSTAFGLSGPDLSIALLSAPPASLFGGVKQKPLQVSVTNAGTAPIFGAIGVNIYASIDNVLDSGDTIVSQLLGGKNIRLKPGQSKKLKVPLTVPATLPSRGYFLIAQVVSSVSDENAANDTAVPAAQTSITQPLPDLSISYAAQPTYLWDIGETASVSLLLTNVGNFDFDGKITLAVYASRDGTLQNSQLLTQTPLRHVKLAAGKGKVIGVSVPTGQFTGTFFIVSSVNPSAVIGDPNSGNNLVVSTQTTKIV